MHTSDRRHVAVVGGGITGLSAAFYMLKQAREQSLDLRITVLERSPEFGGKVRSLRKDGFVIERGPDSFLSRKLPIIELSQELGLDEHFVPTNPQAKKTYIVHASKLHPMPPGLVMGIPTEIGPFVKSGLLSAAGKARAALDLVLPRRREQGDESLGHFLRRRLGKEVQERVAEPLLAGIYAGDANKLSLQATFPQFHAIERKHRSLIVGMQLSRKQTAQAANLPPIAKRSVFLSYRNGLSQLIEALVAALEPDAELRAGIGVDRIDKAGDRYRLHASNGDTLEADAVVVAAPAFAAADMLAGVPETEALRRIEYASVANVVLAYDKATFTGQLDASGYLVPRTEGRFITACTWTSSKWGHASPEDKVLLRCYVGRQGQEEWVRLTDEELIEGVKRDIKELSGIEGEPLFVDVNRWERAMPQYPVGHLDALRKVQASLEAAMPGVQLAGAAYHGIGLPDCIDQGRKAAAQVVGRLRA